MGKEEVVVVPLCVLEIFLVKGCLIRFLWLPEFFIVSLGKRVPLIRANDCCLNSDQLGFFDAGVPWAAVKDVPQMENCLLDVNGMDKNALNGLWTARHFFGLKRSKRLKRNNKELTKKGKTN